MKRLHIIGRKNSGKTTLIVELVQQLRAQGLVVGTVKHTHHQHELDTPGKDSYRHREAGAATTAIVSPATTAVFWSAGLRRPTRDRYDQLSDVFAECDVVLVEGDVHTTDKKIEVWRASVSETPWATTDTSIRALVTDDHSRLSVPVWSRSDLPTLTTRVLELLEQ